MLIYYSNLGGWNGLESGLKTNQTLTKLDSYEKIDVDSIEFGAAPRMGDGLRATRDAFAAGADRTGRRCDGSTGTAAKFCAE